MASYNEFTGTVCQYGHREFYQVLQVEMWGHAEESRRGPTCWRADCPAHEQWRRQESRAS